MSNSIEKTEKKDLTLGEKIVRVTFNPSMTGEVDYFKQTFAALIDKIDANRDLEPRLAARAIDALEDASSLCVKFLTTQK